MNPLLRLDGVGRTFPGPPQVVALRDATFVVNQADHVAVMGPSGSGKSTLLNVMGLLDSATAGTYELEGTSVGDLSDRERTALRRDTIGFVFQDSYILPGRTAWENVALAMIYAGIPARQRKTRARSALERVGLSHRLDALPATMSGGERQRIGIARAISTAPRLLLCDEPTGNLDSVTTEQMMELLAGLNRDGVTIVTITHDPATARWASRQLRIVDGEVRSETGGVGSGDNSIHLTRPATVQLPDSMIDPVTARWDGCRLGIGDGEVRSEAGGGGSGDNPTNPPRSTTVQLPDSLTYPRSSPPPEPGGV